jgi:hypothetical protein
MSDDIPPLRPPDQMPAIRTQTDLHEHWRALMGPLGFSDRSLWVAFLAPDGVSEALLTKIEGIPPQPDRQILNNLMAVLQRVLDDVPGAGVAFLVSRPGPAHITEDDRAWGRDLTTAARGALLPCRPVHLATDEAIRVLAMDDLTDPAAA